MIIKLSSAEVTVKDKLTWGDAQKIQSALLKGVKMKSISDSENMGYDLDAMTESKYVLLELTVKKIKEGEDEKQFTRDWMDSLSIEDGDKL
jgi:hypothetical protein